MKCVVCGKGCQRYLCPDCCSKLTFYRDQYCRICGYPLTSEADLCMICRMRKVDFNNHRTLYSYRDIARFLVLQWKYHNEDPLCRFFAGQMAQLFPEKSSSSDLVIVPVPGNPRNNRKRGYDPVLLLSRRLSSLTGLPVINALRRDKGISQKECSSGERAVNIKGAVRIRGRSIRIRIKNKRVILVDDIYTTGSTLTECSAVLNECAPQEIFCLTIAQD